MLRRKPARQPGQDLRTLPMYTIPEAALYLAIDQWTLLSWYSGRNPLLKPSTVYRYGDAGFFLLSFQDLEEAYKVHLLRTRHEYSLQYLRKALSEARERTASEHPLLTRDFSAFTYLAMHEPGRGRRKRKTIALQAPKASYFISEVVDTWGKRIVSDKKGVTRQIFPWRFAATDEVSRPVLLDPEVMSGKLVVTGTRIPVNVLWKRRQSGEKIKHIADDYNISEERVRMALKHFGVHKEAA